MKKFLGELLASILIVVMTVGSLPNMSYADELLVSPDAYYSETEEGPDGTELIEENLEETDEELPEEISEEGEEESLPVEEISEDESVAEGEEILGEEETVLEEEILGEEEELLDEDFSEVLPFLETGFECRSFSLLNIVHVIVKNFQHFF